MARKADARAKKNGRLLPFHRTHFPVHVLHTTESYCNFCHVRSYVRTYYGVYVPTNGLSTELLGSDGRALVRAFHSRHPKRHSFSIGAVKLQGVSRLGVSGIAFRVLKNIILTAQYSAVFLTNPF